MNRKLLLIRCCFFLMFLSFLTGATAQDKLLTYAQVYERAHPQLLGLLPSLRGWLDDDHYLEYFSDRENNMSQLVKVNAATGKASIFVDYTTFEDILPDFIIPEEHIAQTADYSAFLYVHKNDIYYFSQKNAEFKRLTTSSAKKENPTFSPNGEWIAFTQDHNLYALNVITGMEKQLTHDGSDVIYSGWASWVYYEEILRRKSKYKAFYWSPDSRMIAFLRFDDSPVPQFPLISAEGQHGTLEMQRYPKAGDPLPQVRLGIINPESSELVWVKGAETNNDYIAWPVWSPDAKHLFYQWKNRKQNKLKIYSVDTRIGNTKIVYEETQTSWVNFFEDMTFFEDNSGFILRSDKDGWFHLYLYDLDGRLVNKITRDRMNVSKINLLDLNNGKVYFEGWNNISTENHLFCVNLNSDHLKKLTATAGMHNCTVSPQGSYFYDEYSNLDQPKKIDLLTTERHLIRNIGNQRMAAMDYYKLGKPELFSIPCDDGTELPARWLLPPDFDETKIYPVLFKVYGSPGRNIVKNSFQRLADYYLAQNGIIIISVDHRGSGHFGKKGMSMMYRNLGRYEVDDLILAVKWLYEKPFIDTSRIAISGSSYGGYVTCMALTYGADYFTHGIAGSSVTDWLLYDAVYTERFMDLPQDNPDGYEFASVLTHVSRFKGRLMLVHGDMDDNVHLQNSIQLADKLTDLNKDFELVLVPNARHGFRWSKRDFVYNKYLKFYFNYLLNRDWPLNDN